MNHKVYAPHYANSWGLVVGINSYTRVPPLQHARNDAQAVAQFLVTRLGFPERQIRILLDKDATRDAILESFMDYTNTEIQPDDRILVFFAGHGYTHPSRRGEVGFLIPADGNPEDLSSLIRWDTLTRNSDLIEAKHIFFIMDACYGGLAITRALRPGSMRFLKDMLQRYSRQVLTAGKADEPVSDAAGPLAGHSVFTGHLIQGLNGNAASAEGALTANGLMSYVYERVSRDPHSQQTPHYGFFDGDGDFIFEAPGLQDVVKETKEDHDILVAVPPSSIEGLTQPEAPDPFELAKEYISDGRYTIKLHDLVTAELRKVLAQTSDSDFPVQARPVTIDQFMERLKKYESLIRNLQGISACLAYWGSADHAEVLKKILARFADTLGPRSGVTLWLTLRWYPELLLAYSAGVAALAANKYENIVPVFFTKVQSSSSSRERQELVLETGQAFFNVVRSEMFKQIPGYERYYVPLSEYLFKVLQPTLEDLLFLGKDYEAAFDRFEVFQALVYADFRTQAGRRFWGPVGRFAWKYREHFDEPNPLKDILEEAETQGTDWQPLKTGLFGGSIERFIGVAKEYAQMIAQISWS